MSGQIPLVPDRTINTKTADSFFEGNELSKWADRADYPLEIEEEHLLRKWLPEDRHASVLEGGTGAGRLAFFIERMGFKSIDAFDLMPKLVDQAKAVGDARSSAIRFFQADLCDVAQSDFVQSQRYNTIVYYQQVFSLVALKDWDRAFTSVRELLQDNGKWLVSFCQHEGRGLNRPLRAALAAVRAARGDRTSSYSQPLLKHGGKFNRNFFARDQFLIHWLPRNAIEQHVHNAGFRIIKSVTSFEVRGNTNRKRGMLYLVCEKA